MTVNYYLKNVVWGIIPIGIMAYDWMTEPHTDKQLFMLIFAVVCGLLLPLAKQTAETIALKFTSEEFWRRGFFKEDIGKNGLRAIFYVFCFLFAIPLSIISLFVKKSAR